MSKNIFIKTNGPEAWKDFLAEPDKQWKTGFSAKSLAYCWESQDGFPKTFKKAFKKSNLDLKMLLGIPEYKVFLDTNKAPSQNDLFVLAKDKSGLAAIMVEGKVSEPFDKQVKDWLNDKPSRKQRLDFLIKKLDLNKTIVELADYRYQLFHRTVSAIIAAENFNIKKAIMIVHSFSQTDEWFNDFAKFLTLINPKIEKPIVNDEIYNCGVLASGIELYIGWIKGDKKYLIK
jgi:hypothetical protein